MSTEKEHIKWHDKKFEVRKDSRQGDGIHLAGNLRSIWIDIGMRPRGKDPHEMLENFGILKKLFTIAKRDFSRLKADDVQTSSMGTRSYSYRWGITFLIPADNPLPESYTNE